MKIFVAAYQPGRVGGGWTFTDNFVAGMGDLITDDFAQADVYFIPSPSMVQREEVMSAKRAGKKIVLRIDNAVRNSRNRNTGMTRMKDFSDWADLVVFQSRWAFEYLRDYLYDPETYYANANQNRNCTILNGVDLNRYAINHTDSDRGDNILYSRFNRDETKNWEAARYWFSRYQVDHPDARLFIVGQFSDELRAGNFDFYNNEQFTYYGVADPENLAYLYSITNLLYTYFNDACSNTLIEALVSGCKIMGDDYYQQTGGAPEIIEAFQTKGREYFSRDRMCAEYKDAIGGLL